MTGEIINLRKARKARDRALKEKTAAENRITFGRTKAEREAVKAQEDAAAKTLEGHRLGPDARSDDKPGQE